MINNTAPKKGTNSKYVLNKVFQVTDKDTLILPKKSTIDFYQVNKYLCALMNNKGGLLIIGCDKNNIVRGEKMPREAMDYFQRNIDENLKRFSPSVKGHEYSIKFVPLEFAEDKKVATEDDYIVEISVNVSNYDTLYFTNYDECWIKNPNGAIEQVPVTQISSYWEKHLNKEFEQKRNSLLEKIKNFGGEGLEKLSSEELAELKETILKTLGKLKNRKNELLKNETIPIN